MKNIGKKIFEGAFAFVKGVKRSELEKLSPFDQEKFLLLCDNPIFQNISKEKMLVLYRITRETRLTPGSYLFHEGDTATDFYLVLKGELDILKHKEGTKFGHGYSDHEHSHAIAKLKEGHMVGEMGLIDSEPRSASVRAATTTLLLSISYGELSQLAERDATFSQIYQQVARNITQRLRTTNEVTVHALEQQVKEYKLRVSMGTFMVQTFTALCLFTFSLAYLTYLSATAASSSYVTIPMTIICAVVFGLMIKFSDLPLAAFGLTTQNWRRAVYEGVVYTSIFLAFITAAKWVELHYLSFLGAKALFEPFAHVKASGGNPTTVWASTLVFYWFIVSPLQELIARGALQGSLEVFLTGKRKITVSILVSNLLFATTHLFMSFEVAVIIFLPGLFFGWLYSRNKTLIGVIISHALMGSWVFWILGFRF